MTALKCLMLKFDDFRFTEIDPKNVENLIKKIK